MNSEVINYNANETINLRKGYLNVKLALNLGAFVGHYKFWSKKWIQIQNSKKDNNNNSVEILVSRNEKSENIIFCRSFRSENTAIFRCRSRTQRYSFTICDNNEAIIHLSTDSETESQLWMQCLRNSLWPPDPLMDYEDSIKGHFYGSVIDNEISHRSGLLGAYGYLQLSNANLVLTHPQTGYVIQEWLLSQNTFENPFENVLQIVKNISSFSGIQKMFIYCKDANKIMKRINQLNQTNWISYQGNRVECRGELQKLSLNDRTSSSIINSHFSQTVDRNNTKTDKMKINSIDCNTFRIRSLTEIPESMLNCSLSSTNHFANNQQNTDNIYSEPSDPFGYIESDIYEDIDRIYEEIQTKEEEENTANDFNSISDIFWSKNGVTSQPIDIRNSKQIKCNEEENSIFGVDMFSKIVKQTNIPLIDSKLVNKTTKYPKICSTVPSDNDYYEMKPISERQTMYSSDNSEYVYMKSFSI